MNAVRILLMSFLLFGCNAKEAGLKIITSDIFKPILFQVDNQDADNKTLDLGEHVLTDQPRPIVVKVYNDSAYPYTDMELVATAAGEESAAIAFKPNVEGEIEFPGYGGTCAKTLAPKATCEIQLLFTPRTERKYEEYLTLNYKNFVGPETHKATILILAGMPASLVFTNDVTQYVFGELVGTARVPVVERADALTYTKELEVVNAGGLSARGLSLSQNQTCTSLTTNLCPTNLGDAYSYTSSCPDKLLPGEKCKVTVIYNPRNQSPAQDGNLEDDIKEITYRTTITFQFQKDPTGGMGALNGHFRSISTNIEARFKTSIPSVIFEESIISGNRDSRAFRITNLGYREGAIQGISFHGFGGGLVATCSAKPGTLLLECRDPSSQILELKDLPYTVKDRNDCLRHPSEAPNYISVGAGCVFDIFFQPSVTFLDKKDTQFLDWQTKVIFDSRWQGNSTIVTRDLFTLSANSIAAARVVLESVNNMAVSPSLIVPTGTNPFIADLGRLTVQSPTFYKLKSLTLTFKNYGGVPATGLSFKDGSGLTIPIGTTVSLGTTNPKYYQSVMANPTYCPVILPNATCQISIQFAPILMASDPGDLKQFANMFDGIGLDLKAYKAFQVTYSSGAQFTDTNRENEIADYPNEMTEARLHATLVKKGLLMQMGDDTRNVSGFGSAVNVAGDTFRANLYLRNIGTGTVPYIRLLNPPSTAAAANPKNFNTVIKTPTDPSLLNSETLDCNGLVDVDMTYLAGGYELPGMRPFQGLPQDKSCVLTLEMRLHDRERRMNSMFCVDTTTPVLPLEEGSRLFNRGLENQIDLWEYCGGTALYPIGWFSIAVRYFDGDTTAAGANLTYGLRHTLNSYNMTGNQTASAKMVPHSFSPFLTSTLYRPQYDMLTDPGPTTMTEKWFYGLSSSFFYEFPDPTQTNSFLKGMQSRFFVPTLAAFAAQANYDYIYYLGSFPLASEAISFPLLFKNFGIMSAKVTNLTINPLSASFGVVATPTLPKSVPSMMELLPMNFTFNPSVAGEHSMEVEFDYEDGLHLNPLIYNSSPVASNLATAGKRVLTAKVLVVGHVMAAFPSLSLDVTDYDVVENPGAPPTVTATTTNAATLSWNTSATTSTTVFDTVKLSMPATANDVYALKTFTFTNNSALPISDFNLLFRPDVASSAKKTLSANFKIVPSGTTCVAPMVLAPAASCTYSYMYQPNNVDATDSYVMTMLYRSAPGQYLMQNTAISLLPKAPGFLIEANPLKVANTINFKVAPGSSAVQRQSYFLNFGDHYMNAAVKTFSFDQNSGAYEKLTFINQQATKASLLLSYQRYLAANSLRGFTPVSAVPTATIPLAGEYRTLGGHDFVPIYQTKYSTAGNPTRLLIEASKGCLFGDDENDALVPAHKKGFNNTTSLANPCQVVVTFTANLDYIMDDIRTDDGDDMRNAAAELWYFSVNRSSSSSLWVNVKGRLFPDTSTATTNFSNIQAFDTAPSGRSSMVIPKVLANNVAVGDVIGVRVVFGASTTVLGDADAYKSLTYVDVKPYEPITPQTANFLTGLTRGSYSYYRALAIRHSPNFTVTGRFPGLGAGQYLSVLTNLSTPLKVLTPPPNHYYFHDLKVIVLKELTKGVRYVPFATASKTCTRVGCVAADGCLAPITIKSPGNTSYNYKLINKAVWAQLLVTPLATTYADMAQVTHWTSDPTATVDSKCSMMPGFVPNTSSQMLDSSFAFYLRNPVPATPVNQAVGGVPGTGAVNYSSYVDGAVGYAASRCMISLP